MDHVLIVQSADYNPWYNLALETLLLEHYNNSAKAKPSAILYLWQNAHTVVIGRHQNAWAECNIKLLSNEGGRLARRSTGGGAVYHDLGNLNYSLILPRSRFDLDLTFQIILEAIQNVGLRADRSGRNDLLLNGLKFSGNAFSRNQNAGLHHGTVLVRADQAKIGRYLTKDTIGMKIRGVPSVRSRITHLQAEKPDVCIEDMRQALSNVFLRHFVNNHQAVYQTDSDYSGSDRFNQLEKHYASWEWCLGKSLPFVTAAETRFSWGPVRCEFSVEQGIVKNLIVISDALDSHFLSLIPPLLKERPFNSMQLADIIEHADFEPSGLPVSRNRMARDLAGLLRDQSW